MIEVNSFIKRYGKSVVLHIETLQLANGIYWLRGKNGTGKSTFLKSIAGLLSFQGDIFVSELSLKKQTSAVKAIVNYAPAEPLFPTFLSGYELLQLFVEAKHGNASELDSMLEQLGMLSYIHSPLGDYSSGMLKKVSLVSAFIGKVQWILLDEPFNALDVESVSIIHEWIIKAIKRNISFILSSHQAFSDTSFSEMKELYIDQKTILFADV